MKKMIAAVPFMALCVILMGQNICLAETPETWQSRLMDGSITAIDRNSHEVSIADVSGNRITFLASKRINLDNLHVGDAVEVRYRVAVDIELRKPTADELKNPFEILDETMMEPVSGFFTGDEVKVFKNVVTVMNIERSLGIISVKEARGDLLTVGVSHCTLLENVKLGDTMIVTYTEPLIVTLKKSS